MRYVPTTCLSHPKTIALLTFTLIICVPSSHAKSPRSQVSISVVGNSTIRLQIQLANPGNSWSFRNAYGSALGLAERIQEFQASRANQSISVKKQAAGEFQSDDTADTVTYEARLPPRNASEVSHVSWITSNYGILMLADLLPESVSSASVTLTLPDGWSVGSSGSCDKTNHCLVDNVEREVFIIGRQLRTTSKHAHEIDVGLVTYGNWPIADTNVLKSAIRVVDWYFELTKFRLRGNPTIFLAPLPLNDSSQWKAETRGSTVVLLINPGANFNNFFGQLSIIFTHEVLHLWVPNSLALSGDYDWFFEGFTSYVALQTALRLKLIRFPEYLNTLARVYDSYRSYLDEESLIEASEKRWTSSTPVVYDKGMLVAFLYDLVIRRETEGRSSLADTYRSLLAQHANEPANANDVIIKLLTSSPATEGFSSTYIENRNRIELEKILPSFGFEINTNGPSSHLTVRRELAERQKRLMRSLGYRN